MNITLYSELTLLLKQAWVEIVKIVDILIDPLETNKKAIRFYKKAGFRFVEKRQFGKDKCEVYTLTREDWIKGTIPF